MAEYMAAPPGCKSRPIKSTPILSNEEYDAWIKEVKANEHKRVPKEDYERAMRTYKELMKNANFD